MEPEGPNGPMVPGGAEGGRSQGKGIWTTGQGRVTGSVSRGGAKRYKHPDGDWAEELAEV